MSDGQQLVREEIRKLSTEMLERFKQRLTDQHSVLSEYVGVNDLAFEVFALLAIVNDELVKRRKV